MRTLALELAPHHIRVNTVHPTGVATDMILNQATFRLFLPDVEHPTQEQAAAVFATTNALPVPWVEPIDISNAVLFLASDEARYVTGTELKVDAGYTIR
jgi:NAD(P)-dependent dehydrogenase (short-subunit alcohol dehydrogenase family)